MKGKIAGYVTAALGLVTGLTWNDAITPLINFLLPVDKNGLLAKFIYVVLITAVVVFLSTYLVKLLEKKKPE